MRKYTKHFESLKLNKIWSFFYSSYKVINSFGIVCQGMPGGPAHILAHYAKGIDSVQSGPFKIFVPNHSTRVSSNDGLQG